MKPTPAVRLHPNTGRQAFTLIELLVVIAIIGVLVGVSLPIFKTMRDKSNVVKCVNTEKQWGVAISEYAGDHNGGVYFYAGSGSQGGYMTVGTAGGPTEGPYQKYFPSTSQVQKFRTCPAYTTGSPGNTDVTYGFVRPKTLDGKPLTADQLLYLSRLTNVSDHLLLIDTTFGSKNLGASADLDAYVKPICIGNTTLVRHPNCANALFADFHVESLKWTDIDRDTDAEKARCDAWFIAQ